ncbi:hypothetical protein L1987_56135 [Smallanthus sonchifolius]|uniref:Uncharacterized protein n=1 Tax=Smallanthus sonchifolius TaxID=185202 RepID=A0ACB9EBU2_9ASTR|nr:hypothetical protein L1987_56135 [Smallanthus sonchifolius]
MGYLSHRVDPDQLKPGDHIYTWRTAFTYSHHGIYVGENKVVHFTAPETASSGSGWNLCSSVPSACSGSGWNLCSSVPSACLNSIQIGQNFDLGSPLSTCECGVHQSESGVLVSCLTHFIGTGSLYLYQYGVSKLVYVSKLRGGTCTTAPSAPPQDVIYRANTLLKIGFGAYNVVRNNCEDFALYCKTSLLVSGNPTTGSSGQVNFLVNLPWKSILCIPFVSSPFVAAAGGLEVAKNYWDKYRTDIGVRYDVFKVKVEDVALFRRGC